jgi:hypothetical protein
LIPPARYRRLIRHLHIYIFPQKRAWKTLSTIRVNVLFPGVRHLTIIFDCDLTLSRYKLCDYAHSHECSTCKIRHRSGFLKADIAAVAFDVPKLEVEFVPAQVSDCVWDYRRTFVVTQDFYFPECLHLDNKKAQEKLFALLSIAHASADIEESLELGGSSSIDSAKNTPLLCNRRIQEVKS